MIWEWIQFGLVAMLFLCGFFVLFVSIFGVYRFKFALNRIHAQALSDTLTMFMVLVGCAIAYGFGFSAAKLIMVVAFMWLTSPISAHMLSKLEFVTDEHLSDHCEIEKIDGEEEE